MNWGFSYNAVEESAHEPECWFVTDHSLFGGRQFAVEQSAPHFVEDFHNPSEEYVPAATELVGSALKCGGARHWIFVRCEIAKP